MEMQHTVAIKKLLRFVLLDRCIFYIISVCKRNWTA